MIPLPGECDAENCLPHLLASLLETRQILLFTPLRINRITALSLVSFRKSR